jgi:hypothetical protein
MMTKTGLDISIPMNEVAGKSLIIAIPVAVLQTGLFYSVNGFSGPPTRADMALYAFLLLFGILVHELIHMFVWAFFAKKSLRAFKLGFQLSSFTPYAHCREPMDIRPYRIGSFAPGFLLGFVPWLISLFTANGMLFLFGLLYTTAACGDFLILWVIRTIKPGTSVQDHPTNAGCLIIETEERKFQ